MTEYIEKTAYHWNNKNTKLPIFPLDRLVSGSEQKDIMESKVKNSTHIHNTTYVDPRIEYTINLPPLITSSLNIIAGFWV